MAHAGTFHRTSTVTEAEAMAREVRAYGGTFADYNVIAAYADMAAAKSAVDALQVSGIEAANIALLGGRATEAEMQTAPDETRASDRSMTRDIATRAVTGLIVGAVAGLALGGLLYALFDIGVAASLIAGVIIGGTVGAVASAMWSLNTRSELAELPYRPVAPGHVLVGVRSEQASDVDRSESVLSSHQPLAVHRYDRRGRSVAG